jgi:hypothetical protein
MSSGEKTKPKQFRLTTSEEEAIRELALAGHVKDPDSFKSRTEVGAVRRAIRDAWQACLQTKNRPFPGEDGL